MHSPVSPPTEGAESGTVEGAVEESILMPKLPCNDCKTASISCEDSLTEGAKCGEDPTGLDVISRLTTRSSSDRRLPTTTFTS